MISWLKFDSCAEFGICGGLFIPRLWRGAPWWVGSVVITYSVMADVVGLSDLVGTVASIVAGSG